MKYQSPEMEVLILETKDVVTLSNGGSLNVDEDDDKISAPDDF